MRLLNISRVSEQGVSCQDKATLVVLLLRDLSYLLGASMFHYILLISRQGKIRLTKWYKPFTQKERSRISKEVTNMVLVSRTDEWQSAYMCVYVCVYVRAQCVCVCMYIHHSLSLWLSHTCIYCNLYTYIHTRQERRKKACNFLEWRGGKVVYKRYASLYFCAFIDNNDNELLALEVCV
jgi:hypothetical protein